MTAPANTAYQANFKTPSGALLNIYASDGGEFTELLDAFEQFIPKISAIESLLSGASVVAASGTLAPPAQQTYAAPPAAAAPAAGNVPLCECGEPCKVVPAGVAKATGKPYRSFAACARPRESQCGTRITL
jgi:hypothetical protein